MNFYTYEGKIDFPHEAPSLRSIAVSLARESRYAGASIYWWPVALHTFVVCDLLPPALKIYGLLHDASECILGDIPKPAKTSAIEIMENQILWAIYRKCGLNPNVAFSDDIFDAVHVADARTLHGEVYTVGTFSLRGVYPCDYEASQLVWKYFKQYSVLDCIDPNGACVAEFLRRFDEYRPN